MPSLERCAICGKETLLTISVKDKRLCIECANQVFIKYQAFVEKPKAVDLSYIDRLSGLKDEKESLRNLYEQFRDILHSYDMLDDRARNLKLSTELMEKLYILGQKVRITNILLNDMRSSLESNDISHFLTDKQKVVEEIEFCRGELAYCEDQIRRM
jgi:hypothetical protein